MYVQTGRVESDHHRVCGHTAALTDIKWNPFDDQIIASCSEDTKVFLIGVSLAAFTGVVSPFSGLVPHRRQTEHSRSCILQLLQLFDIMLGDCNPGTIFQSRDFGIPGYSMYIEYYWCENCMEVRAVELPQLLF